jgi:excisionase family DNA binding protein
MREAADLLGVSDDTVRRWADAGRVPTTTESGRRVIEGTDLAKLAVEVANATEAPPPRSAVAESARNRFTGLVTRVVRDTVMAQVEIQCGPHRVVPGVLAIASIKATNVVVEIP